MINQKETDDQEDGISVMSLKPKELSFIDNRRAQVSTVLHFLLSVRIISETNTLIIPSG